MNDIRFSGGEACNFQNKSGLGTFRLFGDKQRKAEKPHTILQFPGGCVEIARTSDGDHWVHVTVWDEKNPMVVSEESDPGRVVAARIDTSSTRYVADAVIQELAQPDFQHLAVLVKRGSQNRTEFSTTQAMEADHG